MHSRSTLHVQPGRPDEPPEGGATGSPRLAGWIYRIGEVIMNGLKRYWISGVVLAFVLVSVLSVTSATKAATAPPTSALTAIRTALHAEANPRYERVVFEFSGPVPLIEAQYVKSLIGGASGLPVAISGNAILSLTMRPAQAHTEQGQSTAPTRLKVGLPNVKEIASSSDFEGVLSYGIGLAQKSEIRVTTLGQHSRVVVDFLNP